MKANGRLATMPSGWAVVYNSGPTAAAMKAFGGMAKRVVPVALSTPMVTVMKDSGEMDKLVGKVSTFTLMVVAISESSMLITRMDLVDKSGQIAQYFKVSS